MIFIELISWFTHTAQCNYKLTYTIAHIDCILFSQPMNGISKNKFQNTVDQFNTNSGNINNKYYNLNHYRSLLPKISIFPFSSLSGIFFNSAIGEKMVTELENVKTLGKIDLFSPDYTPKKAKESDK